MLHLKSMINVIDNTGAIKAELIHVYRVKQARKKSVGVATVGDEVKVVVQKARGGPTQLGGREVIRPRKGEMWKGVIVRVKKEENRLDGRQIRFDESAVVLLNNKGEMLGSRITGPVSASLRNIGGSAAGGRWSKILSLAPKIL
ncbi:ribosomal protein L14 [Naematelia encephala]|uniref:Ribosomal protein L14 n=1 Tax=Naematelia encephala TaxID=71784 RepID=A0A1Y2APZ7_9TREE|nr:ribosomal protein L14 [Naematelia encephala]